MSCAPNEHGLIPNLGTSLNGRMEMISNPMGMDDDYVLYRMETMGGGNCLFHAILTLLSSQYLKSKSNHIRTETARSLRVEISQHLITKSLLNLRVDVRESFPLANIFPYTIWDDIGFDSTYYQQLLALRDEWSKNKKMTWNQYRKILTDLFNGVNYSQGGIEDLFDSNYEVGPETYRAISEYLNMNINVLGLFNRGTEIYSTTNYESEINPLILIGLSAGHYEALWLYSKSKRKFWNVIKSSHPLYSYFSSMFVNERPAEPWRFTWSELTSDILNKHDKIISEKEMTLEDIVYYMIDELVTFISTSRQDPKFYYLYVRFYVHTKLIPSFIEHMGYSENTKRKINNIMENTLYAITGITDNRI